MPMSVDVFTWRTETYVIRSMTTCRLYFCSPGAVYDSSESDLNLGSVLFITSAEEVTFSLCFFVCLFAGLRKKTTQSIFTKFGGKVVLGPRKNLPGFCGNPDHVTLGLGLGYRLRLRCCRAQDIPSEWHFCANWLKSGYILARFCPRIWPCRGELQARAQKGTQIVKI